MTITETMKDWPICPRMGRKVNPNRACPKCQHKGHLNDTRNECGYLPKDERDLRFHVDKKKKAKALV